MQVWSLTTHLVILITILVYFLEHPGCAAEGVGSVYYTPISYEGFPLDRRPLGDDPLSLINGFLFWAQFNQTVWIPNLHQQQCSSAYNNTFTPPRIVPCCTTPGADPTNCHNVTKNVLDPKIAQDVPPFTCLDAQTIRTFSASPTPAEPEGTLMHRIYEFKIANPGDCQAIFLDLWPVVGYHEFVVVSMNVGQYVAGTFDRGVFRSVVVCCDLLRPAVRDYDIIQVVVRSRVFPVGGTSSPETKFHFQFRDSFPLPSFHHYASIEVYMNNTLILPQGQKDLLCEADFLSKGAVVTNNICIREFLPNNDPMFYFYGMGTGKYETPREDNMVVWFMYSVKLFDESLLKTGSVQVKFPNLESSIGNLGDVFFTPVLRKPECSRSKFAQLYSHFQDSLGSFKVQQLSNKELRWRFYSTLAPTLSVNWMACESYIEETLLDEVESFSMIPQTRQCEAVPGTPQYESDPCCNKLLDACCPYRDAYGGTSRLALNTSKLSSNCPEAALDCAKSSLNEYTSLKNTDNSLLDYSSFTECTPIGDNGGAILIPLLETPYYPVSTVCFYQHVPTPCHYGTEDCFQYVGPNSMCIPAPSKAWSRYGYEYGFVCTMPCETDEDCKYGLDKKCLTLPSGVKTCSSITYYDIDKRWNETTFYDSLVQCVIDYIAEKEDPYVAHQFFKQLDITFSLSNIEQIKNESLSILKDRITEYNRCSSYYYFSDEYDLAQCATSQSCNWYSCDTNSLDRPSADCINRCTNPALQIPSFNQTHFCAYRSNPNAVVLQDITQNGNCRLDISYLRGTLSQLTAECTAAYNGTYIPASACWDQNLYDKQEDCLLPDYCPPEFLIPIEHLKKWNEYDQPSRFSHGTYCLYSCVWLDPADITECESVGGKWIVHTTDSNVTYQFCRLPTFATSSLILPGDSCTMLRDAGFNVFFWPGKFYTPKQFYSPETCQPFCASDSTATDKTSCESAYHCVSPFCQNCSKEECLASGWCDALPGTYIPHSSLGDCSHYPLSVYHRIGCRLVDPYMSGMIVDDQYDFFYTGLFSDTFQPMVITYDQWKTFSKDECLNFYNVCYVSRYDNLDRRFYQAGDPSILDASKCTECDGEMISGPQWITGQWVQNTGDWIVPEWTKREMVNIFSPTQIWNDTIVSLIENSVNLRIADFMVNHFTCRYPESTNINDITEMCLPDETTNKTTIVRILDSKSNIENICSNIAWLFSYDFGHLKIGGDFQLVDMGCTTAKVSVIPYDSIVKTESLILQQYVPFSQKNRDKLMNIKNEHNVIVGAVVGSGVLIEIDNDIPSSGISFCLNFNDPVTPNPLFVYSDIGVRHGNVVIPQRLTVTTSPNPNITICVNLTNPTTEIYPLGLYQNQDITYLESYGEASSVLIADLVIYIIMLCFCVVIIIIYEKKKLGGLSWDQITWEKVADIPVVSFFFLIFYLIDRIVFFSLLLDSSLITAGSASMIFLMELPALLYLSIVVFVVYAWLKIIRARATMSSKDPILSRIAISLLVFMYLTWIVCMILVCSLPEVTLTETCEIQPVPISPREIVFFVYTAIYLFINLVMMIGTLVMGPLIMYYVKESSSLKAVKVDCCDVRILRTISILVSCNLFLIMQSFLLITRLVPTWHYWTPYSFFIYVIIMDGSSIVLTIFIQIYLMKSAPTRTPSTTIPTKTSSVASKSLVTEISRLSLRPPPGDGSTSNDPKQSSSTPPPQDSSPPSSTSSSTHSQ